MFQPNAMITFKIAKVGGTVTRDKVTGNPVQQTETVTVIASLEAVENANQTTLPGVDETAMFLRGRMVKPRFLTEAMKANKVVDLVLDRGQNTKLKGKFHLMPFTRSRLGLEQMFGDSLQGFFQLGDG